MFFLLILIIIKVFINRNVVDVLFQWLYLEKILPSLSLGHAIHVSHSCQYEFSDAGREAALPAGDQPPFPGLTGRVG